jgi:hypothetical protein
MRGVTKKLIINFAKMLVGVIVRAATPVIEKELEEFLIKWRKKCVETENPWDDMLADFILDILDIEYED